MFRTIPPSIIRSLRLYLQHHTIQVLWLLASKQPQNIMTHTGCCMYSLRLLMMDGKTVRNMYSVVPK